MTPPTPGLPLTLLAFFLVIGVLVFVHEMGHYLAGRWFGVKAEAFSIGFGREVLGWTDKLGTRWKVGWLPLGGYVKFKGDMSPASEPPATRAWRVMTGEAGCGPTVPTVERDYPPLDGAATLRLRPAPTVPDAARPPPGRC